MEAYELLIQNIDEIKAKLIIGDEYSMLRAGAILSGLLIDQNPLVHIVNKDFKAKFKFPVVGRHRKKLILKLVNLEFYLCEKIHPSTSLLKNEPELLSLDEFLAETIFVSSGKKISVRDLISHCRNFEGGVHFGKFGKKNAVEIATEFANWKTIIAGKEKAFSLTILRPTILVALDGLQELYDLIKKIHYN